MGDITVGNVLVVLLRHIQSPGAIPPLPRGFHPSLSPAGSWLERWEVLLSPLAIGFCPWFFLCTAAVPADLGPSFRSIPGKGLQAPSGVAMPLWCCLYVFPACLLTLAVLGYSFPWEGLCPPWALPESSAPTGDLKHRLRVQPSAGLGVMVRAGG